MDDDARAAYVRQVVPTLRPEDFRPWNDVRPDGRTITEAILAFAPDVLRRQVSMHLAMTDAFIESRDAAQNLYVSCWSLLRERLRQKELVARGWRRGASASEIIPAEFFDAAIPDLNANSLEARHDAYYDIRVAEARHVNPGTSAPVSNVMAESKSSGGRPAKYDWWAFRKELIRGAWAGEFENRRQIRDHMTKWCSINWVEQPDESTLRAEFSKLLPDEIREN